MNDDAFFSSLGNEEKRRQKMAAARQLEVFSGQDGLSKSARPLDLASEIAQTLKSHGFLAAEWTQQLEIEASFAMAAAFTNLSWWLWSGKHQESRMSNASLNAKTDAAADLWETDTLKLP